MAAASAAPLGASTVTLAPWYVEVSPTLSVLPATPAKVARAFWPGTAFATVTGGPPTVAGLVWSAGTS